MSHQHQSVIPSIIRQPSLRDSHEVLTDIYQENCNLAVWQRQLPAELKLSITSLLARQARIDITQEVEVDTAFKSLFDLLGNEPDLRVLAEDIATLVEMYACLFDSTHVGLRLRTLTKAMCPRFHIDRVPCRLVTTYRGVGSQWLAQPAVNYEKLGPGAKGKPDAESGLYAREGDIQTMTEGDVALLKGSAWPGNEFGGIVHRSPNIGLGERRLMLTLDYL